MYLKRITLENAGPIEFLDIKPRFSSDDRPTPLVIVGENGSGKSIFLSHIVNGLLYAQQIVFPHNPEVEPGRVHKLRSPDYVATGKPFSFGRAEFDNELSYWEWQLQKTKAEFERDVGYTPIHKEWSDLQDSDSNAFRDNFVRQKLAVEKALNSNVVLYFPPNRFQEPAWLNEMSLKGKTRFPKKFALSGFSDRRIICESPLKANTDWILDILLDRGIYDQKIIPHEIQRTNAGGNVFINILQGYEGQAENYFRAINRVLETIVPRQKAVRIGIAERTRRRIQLMSNEQLILPNLFQMSSGETSLLNIFLSILRDSDLTQERFDRLDDIRGIVVVDEIDLHLHTNHQREVLPTLMSLFPRIQFIVTTHSPLLILGLAEKLGSDNVQILRLPSGDAIEPEQFSEFESAYSAFRASQRFANEIEQVIKESHKPIVFVEGELDCRYINRAAQLLNRMDLLESIMLKDASGFGNLDKIKSKFDTKVAEIVPQNILLLYDCDKNKPNWENGNVISRTIPLSPDNPIQKGIENLFGQELIQRAAAEQTNFFDITGAHKKTERGATTNVPEKWQVNKDEKERLCEWVCSNGSREDFEGFRTVFEVIEQVLGSPSNSKRT